MLRGLSERLALRMAKTSAHYPELAGCWGGREGKHGPYGGDSKSCGACGVPPRAKLRFGMREAEKGLGLPLQSCQSRKVSDMDPW